MDRVNTLEKEIAYLRILLTHKEKELYELKEDINQINGIDSSHNLTTSKEIPVNELEKIIPPKIFNNYEGVILLVPKKNQDEPPSLIDLDDNTEFNTQSSVHSSIDVEETNLIDLCFDTTDDIDKYSLSKLNTTTETEALRFDSETIHMSGTSNVDTEIIEIDDTTKTMRSKTFVPGCRLPERSNILLERSVSDISNVTKTGKRSGIIDSLPRDLPKSNENLTSKGNLSEISQVFKLDNKSANVTPSVAKRTIWDAPHSTLIKLDNIPENVFPKNMRNTLEMPDILDRKPINFTTKLKYNEILNENGISKHDKNENVLFSDVLDMSNNDSLDRHQRDLVDKLSVENETIGEIAKIEDCDEMYDDLFDELSYSKMFAGITLSSNLTESVRTEPISHMPLPQPVIAKLVNDHDTKEQNASLNEVLNDKNTSVTNNFARITPFIPLSRPTTTKPVNQVDNEVQKAYIDKLLNNKTEIQTSLKYYSPDFFYEPDPTNNGECVLIMKSVKKVQKDYNKRRIITSEIDRPKFTVGPDFQEKQIVLPQIMNILKAKKARLNMEKNFKKRLILGRGASI